MNIDYHIYLNCPDMLDTVINNIRDFMLETLGEEPEILNDPPSAEDEDVRILCPLYQMDVTSKELFPPTLWLSEDYHLDVTVYIVFWVYLGSDHAFKAGHIFRLFLMLSRLYPGDAVLFGMYYSVIYRKTKMDLYRDDGKGENEDYYVKLFEQEWNRTKNAVRLPFRLQTLVFPQGEDCLSIDFDKGYELLTAFLVFESGNAYPAIYKALTDVLYQRKDCLKIGLNTCSLEIHSDKTKIIDDLTWDGKGRFCEVVTEELLLLIQIWADEQDMRLRAVSREEMEAELREILEEEDRRRREEMRQESESKKNKRGWKSYWQKLWKPGNEGKQQEIEEPGDEGQENEKQNKDSGNWSVYNKTSAVYASETEILGIPGQSDRNYPTCFPMSLNRQEIADIICEAYDNKVCVIENAYMGRAKNGMQIALFLSDSGRILKAFPVY